MSASAVEAEKVGFGRGDLWCLRDITLTFYEGETVALLGPPAGGKTLLAQMLCGLQTPTSGRLLVWGHSVGDSPDAVRRLSSAAFGAAGVDQMLTVVENTRLHARLRGLDPSEEKPLTARLLRTFGLSDRRDLLCARLTPGELARLAVVCALLSAPKMLVLDDLLQWMDIE
ncbi:MAG: ATP-binding cassette domain-containing protein, partial [Armatimonadota bacterium]